MDGSQDGNQIKPEMKGLFAFLKDENVGRHTNVIPLRCHFPPRRHCYLNVFNGKQSLILAILLKCHICKRNNTVNAGLITKIGFD